MVNEPRDGWLPVSDEAIELAVHDQLSQPSGSPKPPKIQKALHSKLENIATHQVEKNKETGSDPRNGTMTAGQRMSEQPSIV